MIPATDDATSVTRRPIRSDMYPDGTSNTVVQMS